MLQSQWDDRIKILQWNEDLAKQTGVLCACSTAHVKQLVAHWMATGNLNYPFAWTKRQSRSLRLKSRVTALSEPIHVSGVVQLSELAVHRETLRRILEEDPHSLASILEALVSGLDRDHARKADEDSAHYTQQDQLQVCLQ
jgi:hypothetical protein